MPAGFQLFRDGESNPMIDSNFISHGLVKSGEIQRFYGSGITTNWDQWGFTVNAIAPIVFVEGGAVMWTSARSGNNWTFYVSPLEWLNGAADTWPLPVSESIFPPRYYVFDMMRENKSRVGLEIFTPDGRVCFNSEQWPLNIVATVTPPPPWGGAALPYSDGGGWSIVDANRYMCYRANNSVGLGQDRRLAWNLPWSRGGKGYGGGDDYATWEAMATTGGYIGFTWNVDLTVQPTISVSNFWPVYDVNPAPVTASLIDVTGMPFPFEY